LRPFDSAATRHATAGPALDAADRKFFIDNLLVRIHFILVMIRWTGLAPWEFDSLCQVAPYIYLPRARRSTLHVRPFRVQGSGCRVQGSGFRVQGSGFRVQGSGFRVQGPWSRVQGSGFRVQGSGFRVQGRA